MKIIGRTVSTTMPRADWNQADPGKADYIRNKPTELETVRGYSAYQVAVMNGYEGTEAEWLDSLKGADGAQGPQGEPGEPGEQGPQGPQGEQGPAGADGAKGADGNPGADGEDGYTPVKGTDYFTEEEKAEMVEEVLAEISVPTEINFTNFESGSFTETVNGGTITHTVTFDDSGRPVTVDETTIVWGDA